MQLNIDGLKARIQSDRKRITFDLLQCIDKTSRSSFNKAVVIRGATVTLIDQEDYVILFGEPSGVRKTKGRMEDISLAIDQTFLEYLVAFVKAIEYAEEPDTVLE